MIFGVKNYQHIEGRSQIGLVQSEFADLLDAVRARGGVDFIRQSVEVTLRNPFRASVFA